MTMLSVQDIHTYYGNSHVLQGVSIEVDQGAAVAILGRNGVGKTTLVHSIMGFIQPREGRIIFRGRDITYLRTFKISHLGVGIVPQGRRVFGSLTVKETLQIASRTRVSSMWFMDGVLSVFPRLKDHLTSRGSELSGGEQQMLAIGRALMGNPHFLIMDEPTEGLAPLLVQELGGIIADLKTRGLSILLVEQPPQFAPKLADYVYIMSKGTIVHHCDKEELSLDTKVTSTYLGI
jgi:branched-chain amino acid transport system ATP-binding protein